MLVVIKSSPETEEAKRGFRLANDASADLVLVQNGVYLFRGDGLEGFSGTAYVLDEDMRLRGLGMNEKAIRPISYDELVNLMAVADKVIGMF